MLTSKLQITYNEYYNHYELWIHHYNFDDEI
jgi:hypothetical protein